MEKTTPDPTAGAGTLFIVSTSHMDWDWILTSEQYYQLGPNENTGDSDLNNSVRHILSRAFDLIENTPNASQQLPYQYNLAEVVWIRRYKDDPTVTPIPSVDVLQGRFHFLGGGITSPDNLVSNGEAFIRNYLVGRAYVKSIGLGSLLTDVCWIPDDFGHDPQLPIVINAMGMTATSFWRVPGNEPTPPSAYTPTNRQTPMSNTLKQNSTFRWQASDGSTILTSQMWNGYGVIWDQANPVRSSGPDAYTSLTGFVDGATPAGNLYMAPCGGDFSVPSSILLDTVNTYNEQSGYPPAKLATFQDFVDAVNTWVKNIEDNGGQDPLITQPLDPSNFWTGHFSSRIQLKIDQQVAVNNLMAAETLSTLLQLQTSNQSAALKNINATIDEAWAALVPSTHHDYVNGTSANNVYDQEQLPLIKAAVNKSLEGLNSALLLLGRSVKAAPLSGEIPYLVFNPSGFVRALGILVEIAASPALSGVKSFRIPGDMNYYPVQTLQNGNIVFPYPALGGATEYSCVYFSTTDAPKIADQVTATQVNTTNPYPDYQFGNSRVSFTISGGNAWALSSIEDVENGSAEILAEKGFGNLISMYVENGPNMGNNYQMGQEFCQDPTDSSGFAPATGADYTCNGGSITESGIYLCRFSGTLQNPQVADTTVEYTLLCDEPIIRIRVTGQAVTSGQASSDPNTVVTSWNINGASTEASGGMNYGTPNHWNGPDFVPYWYGPTFRSTHDFLTLIDPNNPTGDPLAAMYHLGMRAWGMNEGALQGILFRNAPGSDRGARGLTDSDMHTQNFAFRIPGVGNPQSCQPLQESIAFQQPFISTPAMPENPTMTDTGNLAFMLDNNAIIRLARPQSADSFVLRIYQPTNSTDRVWDLEIPCLARTNPDVSLVTALEEDFKTPQGPAPVFNKGIIKIQQMPTLATLRISTGS